MIQIVHTFPEITEDPFKPIAFANQSYPYNQISSDRRFEELLYSIAKAQLGRGQFREFDEVSLMSGVSEKGRDCSLFYNGNTNGLIQCKKYEKNLDKNNFGKEITKFVLYSLLTEDILQDPDNFTYFIAVSKGFTVDCSDFIDAFRSLIGTEESLSSWVNYNINKYESLKQLQLKIDETLQQVHDVLSRINVKKINTPDLDAYLSDPRSAHLCTLFFEVRTVTDNSVIMEVKELLLEKLVDQSKEDIKIDQQLDTGSLSLKSERNEFSEINDSHIEREETDQLFKWIKKNPERDNENRALNLCMLVANAGMGKTVILKDLYDRLRANDIPVLGLKADKLAATSIKELQDKIGLSIPIFEFIEKCKQKYRTTVILIDQIDALSQSMSTDRSYLQVFKSVIEQYRHDENIRIIISIRTFDLHYDPALQVYRNIETVTVNPLTEGQVLTQLAKLDVHRNMLNSKLLELLKIPNHLNVFSRIYKSNHGSLGFKTLHDMYLELWTQKITNLSPKEPADRKLTRELLYKIADKMFSIQHITVSELQFEDYAQELSYLKSERLLKKEENQLQFFHQSFYDFVFAKQFVERGLDLRDYIKNNGQTLHLRSAVKMILNYLRDFDQTMYLKTLKDIFYDSQILFHIKHMILSSVLFHETPLAQETAIVKEAVKESYHLMILFFQHAHSQYWFHFADRNSFLEILDGNFNITPKSRYLQPKEQTLLKNKASDFLHRAAILDYNGSWKFILERRDQSFARRILRATTNWDDPIKYSIFEDCKDFKQIDPYGYYRTVDNIAHVNPSYAINLMAQDLSNTPLNDGRQDPMGPDVVLNTLLKTAPTQLFLILFSCFEAEFKTAETEKKFWGNYKYMQVRFQDRDFQKGRASRYILLAHSLRNSAQARNPEFLSFFETNKDSEIMSVLRLLIFALDSDPIYYSAQTFELCSYLLTLNEIYYDSTIAVESRTLFEKTFPFFNLVEQSKMIKLIKELKFSNEIMIIKLGSGKKKISTWWGLTKYYWIKRLPAEIIASDPELKQAELELARRFPDYKDRERSGHVMAGVVQTPIPPKAYKHMKKVQWLDSFKKYDGSKSDFDRPFLKGDIQEHAYALKKCVQEDPTDEMIDIISSALNDPDIQLKYAVYGLWGLSESEADKKQARELFKQILKLPMSEELQRVCRYIAENLSKNQNDDSSIIDFLLSCALDFSLDHADLDPLEEDTSVDNLVTQGLNTASGSAASALVHIIDSNYFDQVFRTLKIVFEIAPAHCRAAALYQFAYLMNADPARAFEIFSGVVNNENSIHVLASSIWSMHYMANYNFEALIPAFERLVSANCLGQDDSQALFNILYFSDLYDKTDANALLYRFMENNKYVYSFAIGTILHNYYAVPAAKQKSDQLLDYVLERLTEEDYDNHGINFNESIDIKLSDISTFLTKYIQSPFFRVNDSLIEYLTSQCKDYPHQAIELFEIVLNTDKFKDDQEFIDVYTSSGTKFILCALSSIDGNDNESISARWNLTLAFDRVLMDDRFSRETEKILDDANL